MRTKSLKKNKINVITLGCSKNIYDSEVLMGQLRANNMDVVHEEKGNIVVINTCGFIDNAKAESINTILEYADKKERGIPKTTVGVQVATVANGSPADDAGLVPGAIITHANGTILNSITDVDAILKGNPQTIRLQVIGGRSESAGGSGLTRGLIVIRLR